MAGDDAGQHFRVGSIEYANEHDEQLDLRIHGKQESADEEQELISPQPQPNGEESHPDQVAESSAVHQQEAA